MKKPDNTGLELLNDPYYAFDAVLERAFVRSCKEHMEWCQKYGPVAIKPEGGAK